MHKIPAKKIFRDVLLHSLLHQFQDTGLPGIGMRTGLPCRSSCGGELQYFSIAVFSGDAMNFMGCSLPVGNGNYLPRCPTGTPGLS